MLTANLNISNEDLTSITQSIGRPPRGLRTIPVRDSQGKPSVLQVASLVDNKPFPTVFWLVDKKLCLAIDQLEASGLIQRWQQRIDANESLQQQLSQDHQKHIAMRWRLTTEAERQRIHDLNFTSLFEERGIGGIQNFTRIRCLHTYYAAHLIESNLIGIWLDTLWTEINDENFQY